MISICSCITGPSVYSLSDRHNYLVVSSQVTVPRSALYNSNLIYFHIIICFVESGGINSITMDKFLKTGLMNKAAEMSILPGISTFDSSLSFSFSFPFYFIICSMNLSFHDSSNHCLSLHHYRC
jgi:hypothetical protein